MAPAGEPVSLADLRTQLGLTATGSPLSHPDDAYVTGLGIAARRFYEAVTGRSLVTQTWAMTCDDFPASSRTPIFLPKAPVQAVSSIQYIDTDGATQTWDSSEYQTDLAGLTPRLLPGPAYSWPVAGNYLSAVTITFVTGYAATSSPVTDHGENVPEEDKLAIKALAAHWYEHRTPVAAGAVVTDLPFHLQSLFSLRRIPWVF